MSVCMFYRKIGSTPVIKRCILKTLDRTKVSHDEFVKERRREEKKNPPPPATPPSIASKQTTTVSSGIAWMQGQA